MDHSTKQSLRMLITKLVVFIVILGLCFGVLFGITRVSDQSMSPAFKVGDLVLYNRLEQSYETRDCIVIKKSGKTQVVRIIAQGGDRVECSAQGLKINGFLQQEKEINGPTLPYKKGITFPVVVPAHQYFVLSDTRTNARDSRYYGCVSEKEIKGSVMAVLRRRGF